MEHRISIVFTSQTYRNIAIFYRTLTVLLSLLKRPLLLRLRAIFHRVRSFTDRVIRPWYASLIQRTGRYLTDRY